MSEEFDLDKMLENYRPVQDTFEVPLPTGDVLTFRVPQRKSEADDLLKSAMARYLDLPERGSPQWESHFWKEYWPESTGEFSAAFRISELSVTPKLTMLDALKMLRCPSLVDYITDQLDQASGSMMSLFRAQAVEDAKKNFEKTGTEGSKSKPGAGTQGSPKNST